MHSKFDLRYLSQSSRQTHFATSEVYETQDICSVALQAENIDELQELWRRNKKSPASFDETDAVRLENVLWRKAAMKLQQLQHKDECWPDLTIGTSPSLRTSLSLPTSPAHGPSEQFRKRSFTGPAIPVDLKPRCLSIETADEVGEVQSNPVSPRLGSERSTPRNDSRRSSPLSFGSPGTPFNQRAFDRGGGIIGKGALCVEYSDHGTGDFRSPSFVVLDNFDGSSISPLRYRTHEISRGKPPMPDSLPGVRSYDNNDASTLVVTMWDVGSGLEVDLIYGMGVGSYIISHISIQFNSLSCHM